MASGGGRPITALSLSGAALGFTGLAAVVVAAALGDIRTGLLVTMYPSHLPRSAVIAAAGVLLAWLAFAAALHLLGRRLRPGPVAALGLSALARTALLPQLLVLPLLARRLAKVELNFEAAFPLKLASFAPETWGLMAAYTLAVIFALWAHATVYHQPHQSQRFDTGGFLLVFLAAAAAQHALLWGLCRLVG
jgi:hypothetical protein